MGWGDWEELELAIDPGAVGAVGPQGVVVTVTALTVPLEDVRTPAAIVLVDMTASTKIVLDTPPRCPVPIRISLHPDLIRAVICIKIEARTPVEVTPANMTRVVLPRQIRAILVDRILAADQTILNSLLKTSAVAISPSHRPPNILPPRRLLSSNKISSKMQAAHLSCRASNRNNKNHHVVTNTVVIRCMAMRVEEK